MESVEDCKTGRTLFPCSTHVTSTPLFDASQHKKRMITLICFEGIQREREREGGGREERERERKNEYMKNELDLTRVMD